MMFILLRAVLLVTTAVSHANADLGFIGNVVTWSLDTNLTDTNISQVTKANSFRVKGFQGR